MARHGRYTIIRKLANGGMAEIFLAKQQGAEGFQKPVVLKRILSSVSADPQFRNMLIDEAHISMSLTHSNIVQVLDLGQAGGRTFLVLELVDGWDLSKLLARAKGAGRRLPFVLGVFVATETCRGLAYAHAKSRDGMALGIVHRDVSPNNVLISEQGEVKLADFGIAKALGKRENTGTGVVKGKVAFMSPEQALGKPLDARSDLFSLGSLLYLLMVGHRPFEASTDLETLLRVQRADFKHPAAMRPDLEAPIASIIERAMMLEPRDRYQSADDMLVEMERVLRRIFGGIGQTELKLWLQDLGRVDHAPTIANQKGLVDSSPSSSERMEGKAVELGDAFASVDVEAKTSLAVVGGTPLPVMTAPPPGRALTANDSWSGGAVELVEGPPPPRPTQGPGTARTRRRDVEELPLPEGEGEAPPLRLGDQGRGGHTGLWILVFLAVLGGGGYLGVRMYGVPPAVARFLHLTDDAEPAVAKDEPKTAPSGTANAATASPPKLAPAPKGPAPGAATTPSGPSSVTSGAPAAAAPSASSGAPSRVAASVPAAPPAAPVPSKEETSKEDRRAAARAEAEAANDEPREEKRTVHSRSAVDEARERVKRLTQSPDYVPPPSSEPPTVPAPP